MKFVLIFFIKIYQLLISPFLLLLSPFSGRNCRFYPSCSSYAIQALESKGIIKGSWLALKRIMRCNPFCEGGYDPVDKTKTS